MAVDFEYYDVVGRIGLSVNDGDDPDDTSDILRPEPGAQVHFTPSEDEVHLTVGGEYERRAVAVHIGYVDTEGYLCESADMVDGSIVYGDRGLKLPRLKGDRVNPAVPADKGDWTMTFHDFSYVADKGTEFARTVRVPHEKSALLLKVGEVNDIGDPSVSTLTAGPGVAIVVGPRGYSATDFDQTAVDKGRFVFTDADGNVVGQSDEITLPPGAPGGSDTSFAQFAGTDGTQTRAALDAAYPRKGSIVFNVKDYGAAGDGVVDDTVAIRACFTAAAAANLLGSRVLVAGAGSGYRTTDTITIPNNVDVDMALPFAYDGPADRPVLTAGDATRQSHRKLRLRARRKTVSTWADENDVAVRLINYAFSEIDVVEARACTIGLQCIGRNDGFVYNEVHLGQIVDNKIGVDLTNDKSGGGIGWCNENIFIGGSFNVFSSTNNTLDRIGIRFNSMTADYYNNNNVFQKPSFEIKGGVPAMPYEGLAVEARYGSFNTIRDARHESPDAVGLRQLNESNGNLVEFGFSLQATALPYVDDAGTFGSGTVTSSSERKAREGARLIYKADALQKRACYYDGASSVAVPGVIIGGSGTTVSDLRATSGLVMNPDYLEVPGSRMVGFYVSTRIMKSFAVATDADVGYGGRLLVRAHNAAGQVVSTALAVRSVGSNPAYATAYGGAFRMGTDNAADRHFKVSAEVDYVFVGVTGSTNPARLRSIAAYTLEKFVGAAWAFPNDLGRNYGTTPPTAGTWEAGREVFNVNPSSGAPRSWICTVGGTPGTWVASGQLQTSTASSIALGQASNSINLTDKFIGKMVYNTTTGKPVWASGAAVTDTWKDATGTVAHTPA